MITDPMSIGGDNRLGNNFVIFMPLIMEKPFGLYDYAEELDNRQTTASGDLLAAAIDRNFGQAPHNVFLTSALAFGLPAAVAQILLYLSILRRSIWILRFRQG